MAKVKLADIRAERTTTGLHLSRDGYRNGGWAFIVSYRNAVKLIPALQLQIVDAKKRKKMKGMRDNCLLTYRHFQFWLSIDEAEFLVREIRTELQHSWAKLSQDDLDKLAA